MIRQQQMLSTGGCPRDTSMGAARATGVPNPEQPSIMYANAQPIRNTSATGCPEDKLRTLDMIQGRHFMASQNFLSMWSSGIHVQAKLMQVIDAN